MRSSHIVASAAGAALVTLVTLLACSPPGADAGPSDGAPPPDDAASSDGDDADASNAATFVSVTARAIGRTGGDLEVTVQAEDPTRTAYGIHIRLHDTAGNRVLAFEGNWNGAGPGILGAAAAERRVLFDPSSAGGQETFTRTVTLPGFLKAYPTIATVEVAVLTAGDHHSNKLFGPVTAQPVRTQAQTCDPALLADRCTAGLACTGTPPTCAKASAPTLAQLAWIPGPDGPHMLFEGPDPAGEVARVHVEFLDANGAATMVDTSGNGDFAKTQEISLGAGSSFGSFFFDHVAPQGFDTKVPRLAATPVGTTSGPGTRTTARFGAPPLKPAGEACDPHGFIGCTAGNVCTAGATEGASACADIAAAKASITAAAPTLDMSQGQALATGYARGASLWDPPPSCLPSAAAARPEGIVRLHVPLPVATLTISTAVEETNFDTVLYVLPGSGGAEDTAMGCNDDAKGSASTLTLTDVAAGDYTIVVDSKGTSGGQFGLTVR